MRYILARKFISSKCLICKGLVFFKSSSKCASLSDRIDISGSLSISGSLRISGSLNATQMRYILARSLNAMQMRFALV